MTVSAVYCGRDILSVGMFKFIMLAPEIKYFNMGAQKWVVLQHVFMVVNSSQVLE